MQLVKKKGKTISQEQREERKRQRMFYSRIARPDFMALLAESQGRTTPFCELCLVIPATDLHHKWGRDGYLLIDMRFFAGLCHGCHVWVTNNWRRAKEKGLVLPRNMPSRSQFVSPVKFGGDPISLELVRKIQGFEF